MRRDAPQAWPYSADLHKRAPTFAQGSREKLAKAADLIQRAPEIDGQPKGTGTSDPVAAAAERREKVTAEIRIVEGALEQIPEKYRHAVLRNACDQVPAYKLIMDGELEASDSTLYDYRIEFLSWIVVLAGWDVHWSLLEEYNEKYQSH